MVDICILANFVYLQVHLCMSTGETFPNLHGQLDVTGLAFQIYDAPSWFSVCPCFIFSITFACFHFHLDISCSMSYNFAESCCSLVLGEKVTIYLFSWVAGRRYETHLPYLVVWLLIYHVLYSLYAHFIYN